MKVLKKDPESNSHITPCNTTASHIDDHTYAKDADQADSSRSHQIPQSVQKVLPTGYQYSCHEFREIPSQNFTAAPQENFYVKLSVSNITTKEDVDQWLQQFISSNIKYNAQAGYKRKGVKVIYARWYICQCKRKKLTKKASGSKGGSTEKKRKEAQDTQRQQRQGRMQVALAIKSKGKENRLREQNVH